KTECWRVLCFVTSWGYRCGVRRRCNHLNTSQLFFPQKNETNVQHLFSDFSYNEIISSICCRGSTGVCPLRPSRPIPPTPPTITLLSNWQLGTRKWERSRGNSGKILRI